MVAYYIDINQFGEIKSDRHITRGGTSSEFVKGDGSLDGTSYASEDWVLNQGFLTDQDLNVYTAGEGLELVDNEFSLKESVLEAISKAHTHPNKDILDDITSSDIEDWEEAYDKIVRAISFTGDTNKTLTVTKEDGSILTASFLDNNDPQFPDDVLNTLTFNDNNDGVLRAITSEGSIIDVSLDGRYSLLGHKHVWADITDRPTSLSDFTNDLGNYGNWITKAQGDTYYSAIGHTHSWGQITGKPSTFTPSSHTHNADDINAGVLAVARIPTGTSGSTVALGNHTHTWEQIENKPTNLETYGISDAVTLDNTGNKIGNYTATHSESLDDLRTVVTYRGGNVLSMRRNSSYGGQFRNTTDSNNWRGRTLSNGVWSDWNRFWHDGNLPNPATQSWVNSQGFIKDLSNYYTKNESNDIFALSTRTILAGTGLTGGGSLVSNRTIALSSDTQDDIAKGVTAEGWGNHSSAGYFKFISALGNESIDSITVSGFYQQQMSANASVANSYPSGAIAGMLRHYNYPAYKEQYYSNRTGRTWHRTFYASWSDWNELWHTGNLTAGTTAEIISGNSNNRIWSGATLKSYFGDNLGLQGVTDIGNWTSNAIDFVSGSNLMFTINDGVNVSSHPQAPPAVEVSAIQSLDAYGFLMVGSSDTSPDYSNKLPHKFGLLDNTAVWANSFTFGSDFGYRFGYLSGYLGHWMSIQLDTMTHDAERLENATYTTAGGGYYNQRLHFPPENNATLATREWVLEGESGGTPPSGDPTLGLVWDTHIRKNYILRNNFVIDHNAKAIDAVDTTYSGSTSITLSGTSFRRAALTGDVTAAANNNATTIANNAVTHAKYQNIATQRILGRGATGSGNVQELTLGSNLSLSTAGVLSATNTTYSQATLAQLKAGTNVSNRLINPRDFKEAVETISTNNLQFRTDTLTVNLKDYNNYTIIANRATNQNFVLDDIPNSFECTVINDSNTFVLFPHYPGITRIVNGEVLGTATAGLKAKGICSIVRYLATNDVYINGDF